MKRIYGPGTERGTKTQTWKDADLKITSKPVANTRLLRERGETHQIY